MKSIEEHGLLEFLTCDKPFQLRHLREISLTMFPLVWDTTAINKDNPIFAQKIQAHHLSADTTCIYTNCKVDGAVACKGHILDTNFDYELETDCDEPAFKRQRIASWAQEWAENATAADRDL